MTKLMFCFEPGWIHHLFFDCCVAKALWVYLSECLDLSGVWSYESVSSLWIANNAKSIC